MHFQVDAFEDLQAVEALGDGVGLDHGEWVGL